MVNGRTAQVLSNRAGVMDWRVELADEPQGTVVASAIDVAGNAEKLVHQLKIPAR
jgi:hypothetical protein